MANLYSLAQALRMYRLDEGSYPPPYDPTTGQGGLSALSPWYLSSLKPLRCPDDPTSLTDYNTAHGANWDSRLFTQLYSSYNETYNYWGYDSRGKPLKQQADAEPVYADKADRLGRALWSTGGPSAVFPGLANRNAPDNTIIAHCPWHSGRLPPGARKDLIVRLDGSAMTVEIGSYDWVAQPPTDQPRSAE